jgi:uncharacterized lipoprotein YmbA
MKGASTMMAGSRLIAFGFIAMLLLAACSSSSPVRYFSLNPIDTEFRQDPDDSIMLGLGPFRMPDYLNRSQIVTRGANAEMQVDEFSRWSEPLATSMLRIISADVDNLLEGVVVVVFPYEPFVRNQVKYRLVGDINRFEADYQGRIVLEVQWGITDTEGQMAVPVRRNRYQAQVAQEGSSNDGTSAVVAAMNDALAQFSRDIASKLQPAL